MAFHHRTGGCSVMLRRCDLALLSVVAEFRVSAAHADMHKAAISRRKGHTVLTLHHCLRFLALETV